MRSVITAVVLLLSVPASGQVQSGDLVFQRSRSSQSRVIAEVTGSRWTHVGIVFERDGALWVLEAVEPVRWTRWETWQRRGRGGQYAVRRAREGLDEEALRRLRAEGERLLGRAYDARFEWTDERIYCSELVWLMFERAMQRRLVEPKRWRDLHLSAAAQRLARARLGRLPPPDGELVTPAALLESEQLYDPRAE